MSLQPSLLLVAFRNRETKIGRTLTSQETENKDLESHCIDKNVVDLVGSKHHPSALST